jgi:hypothetical protein
VAAIAMAWVCGPPTDSTQASTQDEGRISIRGHTAGNTSAGLTDLAAQRTTSNNQDCQHLKKSLGFWSDYQCQLWKLIEDGATIDMAPYMAENVPRQEKWWSSNLHDPTASGPSGRIVYHLHLHKCMGSTFCSYFKRATVAAQHPANANASSSAASAKTAHRKAMRHTVNPADNCNVPDSWWWNRSQPDLHFQSGAYIGATRQQMRQVHKKIRARGWVFVASEGSLELEPIFGRQSPYYYSTILREPFDWVVSMWHFYEKNHGHGNQKKRKIPFDDYLTTNLWGTPDFFTRRICGVGCVRADTLTTDHFLRAKSMLDHFDLVIAQGLAKDTAATAFLLSKAFPALTFPKLRSAKTNAGHYATPTFSSSQVSYVRNQTLMDKVLYEYAKVLHQRSLDSYGYTRKHTGAM